MPVSFLSPLSSSLLWTRCWEMVMKGILPALRRGLQGGLTKQACGLIPFTLAPLIWESCADRGTRRKMALQLLQDFLLRLNDRVIY